MTTAFLILFIWLGWRITLLKQRGLCELSEIAEILSIVNVMVFRLFIYLIVWKHGNRRGIAKDHKFKETEDTKPTRDKGFLWTEVVFENKFVPCSSCYRILNRILNWQELRRIPSVYRESFYSCNLQCLNKSIIRVSSDKHIRTPCNLDMKRCQIL